MGSPYISVVSPVFGCKDCLYPLYERLSAVLKEISQDFEIILVNDSSPGESWNIIQELCEKDNRVKGICLSRNFGQHYAITAGLDHVSGEWIVVMDCDLQDRPEEITSLYKSAMTGYDMALARRINRKDDFMKRLSSKLFYKAFYFFSGLRHDDTISNFGIYNRRVIDAVKMMAEPYRAFSMMARWVGFSKCTVDVEHGSRLKGRSAYTWATLIDLAIDAITAYSDRPLRIIIQIGFFISALSFIASAFFFISYFFLGSQINGIITITVAMFFLFGIIIMFLGVLGIYIGKIFDGVKNRPLYIINHTKNL
jgi:dolichol-phosphate mannosyltransferase